MKGFGFAAMLLLALSACATVEPPLTTGSERAVTPELWSPPVSGTPPSTATATQAPAAALGISCSS